MTGPRVTGRGSPAHRAQGVSDARAALQDQLLEPLRAAAAQLFQPDLLRMVAGSALARTDESATALMAVAVEQARSALGGTAETLAAGADAPRRGAPGGTRAGPGVERAGRAPGRG